MPSSTGTQESKMKSSLPSLHVRLPSTDSGIQADAGSGFDSLSRYKGKNFLSSSGHKVDSSNASMSASTISDSSQSNIHSPFSSSSGYCSEARDTTPTSISATSNRTLTPPISFSSTSSSSPQSQDSSSSFPVSMTSSWAGATPFSKSKPSAVEIELSKNSALTGIDDTGKIKRSTINIPPKPKNPPPKRPMVNPPSRPASSAPPTSSGGVKMITTSEGIHVSISRTNPTTAQSSARGASQASHITSCRTADHRSEANRSHSNTTIDVRPSPGSTVKVKFIGSGGSRPQAQPRSSTTPPRQGQGCIPLTRPLRIAPPSSAPIKRAAPRIGVMSHPPPPPPHSEKLQQFHQRQQQQTPEPQIGERPRPLGPKPQISPRKTFLTPRNSPCPTSSNSTSGDHNNTTTTTNISLATASTASVVPTSTTAKSVNVPPTNIPKATHITKSSISSINIPISNKHNSSLQKDNKSNIQIKSNQDCHVYNSPAVSRPSSISTPRSIANKNIVDSCTFKFKSPEKSFFTQTFYTKDSSVKSPSKSEATSSFPASSSSSKFMSQDHGNLGFIREDLKAGDRQARMRHAELLQKKSDDLFKDAWSFLNASDEEIDRVFFGDDFFHKCSSPSPDRKTGSESTENRSSMTSEERNVVTKEEKVNSAGPLASENNTLAKHSEGDKGESVPWKTRKERIDSALSWLKRELANLRDMDKNIVNQFRRCQDTIETLKSQREIWEGLSEEGEEGEYWDDIEINEFNRNYLNSPEGSSLSPMSTGSLSFQDFSTVVSLPVPQLSPTKEKQQPDSNTNVTQDVEAML